MPRRPAIGSASRSSKPYLRRRTLELASPTTRSFSDPLGAWAERRIRLEGRPFSFRGHGYLRAIFDDTSPHVVLSKAAQIGGTTWAILRAIHACLTGLNVIYFFPTRTDVLEFSKSRVAPLLAENPFLWRLLRDTDTAGLKRIGDAHLYLRGMQSTVGMKSVPADLVIFDELDEAEPAAKAMAKERLAHSDYKRLIELSNPSIPDYGIDEIYQRSDQRHWTLRCPSCGTWSALEKLFPQKLGQDVPILRVRADGTVYRACPNCQSELDPEQGEWVADFPSSSIHGYRISQLFSTKVNPKEILDEYRTTRYPERFYNLKIGIPWTDLGRKVDAATVLALCGSHPLADAMPGGYCSMGVDTGRELHVVILHDSDGDGHARETKRLVFCGAMESFEQLDELMRRFNVARCVVDGLPETHATREFIARHRYHAWMCFFNEHQRGAPKFDYVTHMVTINRTEAIDASRAAVRDARLVLPRRMPLLEEFARHVACDAKVLDEDEETGIKKYRYIRTGPNHYSMALTYAWMGITHRRYRTRWGGQRPC
ncbi:MAG: phage terminase large subunit family protein [Candidatus Eisenbacteria bacterium]